MVVLQIWHGVGGFATNSPSSKVMVVDVGVKERRARSDDSSDRGKNEDRQSAAARETR